jgi:excisionase family DNA binding protein
MLSKANLMTGSPKRLLSTADIARLLSIDVSTVKRWADSGKLHCCKTVGGHRRFRIEQAQALIADYDLGERSSPNSVTEPDMGSGRQ